MRRVGVCALFVILAAALAAPARATVLEGATINAQVQPDGSLQVSEQITMSNVFHGGYRDIPLREGESIDQVKVSELGSAYTYGGSTELGSVGQPSTYATTRVGDALRVVWHFDNPSGGPRTFTISYRFRGLAVAYNDVVDVNLNVWGSGWGKSLPTLRATLHLPGPTTSSAYRVWGGPAWVSGAVDRSAEAAVLQASAIPAHQNVDLRVLFPRSLLTSTDGARVVSEDALGRIVTEQEASFANYDREQRRLNNVLHSPLTWLTLLLLAFVPGIAALLLVYVLYGHEPRVDYDRRYEQEPPSELAPALVPALTRESTGAGANELTATLFDLIRRGRYKAEQISTETSTWGGLHKETVSDLELTQGKKLDSPTPWEDAVSEITDSVVGEKGERLSHFHLRIADHRSSNAARYQAFVKAIKGEIEKQKWYSNAGLIALLISGGVLLLVGVILLVYGIHRLRVNAPRLGDVVPIALGICGVVNAAIVAIGSTRVPLWRSRTKPAELEAARWTAFRRYLNDFPRLEEAPPASIALWEKYLVYGIAFGLAERVLKAAQLYMPAEMHDQSSIFWISSNGDLGSGASSLGISELTSGLSSALAPPSTSGSGIGGGFGGGGFGGGGGGGGGGW